MGLIRKLSVDNEIYLLERCLLADFRYHRH
jgi:hypothetical protein